MIRAQEFGRTSSFQSVNLVRVVPLMLILNILFSGLTNQYEEKLNEYLIRKEVELVKTIRLSRFASHDMNV